MNDRKGFGSNFGFLMAAVGSAVGLGNIWGFPNKMGANGGFPFLILYLALALCCGVIIMLGELADSLKDKGITFTYDDALVSFLTKKSFSRTYGARNLRRTIQKELEDPMATKIIDSYEHPVSQVKATVEDEAVKLYTL